MTNKEKYKKEILEVAIYGDAVAFSKVDNKVYDCKYMKCKECEFFGDTPCSDMRAKWADEEYVDEPCISKSDRKFLDFVKDDSYITRDSDGKLYCYNNKPVKNSSAWSLNDYGDICYNLSILNIHFPMVKWEDEEPWQVKKLKQLKIED